MNREEYTDAEKRGIVDAIADKAKSAVDVVYPIPDEIISAAMAGNHEALEIVNERMKLFRIAFEQGLLQNGLKGTWDAEGVHISPIPEA